MVVKKLIMCTLGVIVGLAFIVMGAWVLLNPIFGDLTEKLSHISQILLGLIFLFYGVTGYNSVYKYRKRRKNQ